MLANISVSEKNVLTSSLHFSHYCDCWDFKNIVYYWQW